MTQQEVIKWWPEIEAFKNGKTIEARKQHGVWRVNTNPNFCLTCEYRVKEDPPEPEYVPFDFLDVSNYIGMDLVKKGNKDILTYFIQYVNKDGVLLKNYGGVTFHVGFSELYINYVFFSDGSPCGKLKE